MKHADGRRITDIYLQVGKMSFVVPEAVESFFQYLSEGTLAEGAQLHFELVPIEMTCKDCDRKIELKQWAEERPQVTMQRAFASGCQCGGANLRVTDGLGFDLVSIDVDETTQVP